MISYAGDGSLPSASSHMVYRRGESSGDGGSRRGWVASVDGSGNVDSSGHSWWFERDGELGTASVTNGLLFSYVEDTDVYICPTHARLARRIMSGDRQHVTRSYGMNQRLSNRRPTRLDGHSRRMLLADQGFENIGQGRQLLSGNNNGPTDSAPPGPSSSYWDNNDTYRRRYHKRVDGAIDAGPGSQASIEWIGEYHGRNAGEEDLGRAHVVFLDGHVEQVKYIYTDYVATGNWENGEPIGEL